MRPGLKGGWNFKIGWSSGRPTRAPDGGQAGDAAEPAGLTATDAVEKLMGVKLVKAKRSIPVIVVDHVDEKPME